jgi:hypothetical protein
VPSACTYSCVMSADASEAAEPSSSAAADDFDDIFGDTVTAGELTWFRVHKRCCGLRIGVGCHALVLLVRHDQSASLQLPKSCSRKIVLARRDCADSADFHIDCHLYRITAAPPPALAAAVAAPAVSTDDEFGDIFGDSAPG